METYIKTNQYPTKGSHFSKLATRQSRILVYYIFRILPQVNKLLSKWEREAKLCSEAELRQQALASLDSKAFHCQGGAVFAIPCNNRETVLKLIVAYQTICDYLDNLCDRAGSTDGRAFLQLHQALIDALTPGKEQEDYYRYFPLKDDGTYLEKLIRECRLCIEKLPSYFMVYDELMRLVDYYIQLQVKKHLALECRENDLINWVNEKLQEYPEIYWQEFAAASGSTLAVFALFDLASRKNLKREHIKQSIEAYFPWICGLHILLDYLIDQTEDREGGDLNFTFYYKNHEEMLARLKLFVREAHRCTEISESQAFDKTVVEGLLAMYLSDSKVKKEKMQAIAAELLNESGAGARRTYRICSLVRKVL